mmetsp:Transcript_1618/g.4434  ORF Transcript_1618/g.4434 Transcript_1618/m.4434 type:complete len:102 (-) Transcript_1618:196-501(-)
MFSWSILVIFDAAGVQTHADTNADTDADNHSYDVSCYMSGEMLLILIFILIFILVLILICFGSWLVIAKLTIKSGRCVLTVRGDRSPSSKPRGREGAHDGT